MAKRLTNEEFVSKSKSKYGEDAFDYSRVVYVDAKTKVELVCRIHGSLWQTPNSHLAKNTIFGCNKCATEASTAKVTKTKEKFIEDSIKQHGNLFGYEGVVYKNGATKVSILCNKCGRTFSQTPNNHLNGNGCSFCSKTGYKIGQVGKLYILSCGEVTKIGITNRTAKYRANLVSNSYGKRFDVISEWTIYDGKLARRIEKNLIEHFRTLYAQPTSRFDGHTECFIAVDQTYFRDRVREEVISVCLQ